MSANAGMYTDDGATRVAIVGGGGGGGSATTPAAPGFTEIVSDTSNQTTSYPLGTQADAAYTGTGSASQIALLKGIYTLNAGTMAVRPQLSTNPTTAQVTLTSTTFAQILASTAATTPREIKNTGTVTVFIGPTGVTATTGHALLAGESFTPWWTGAVFGCLAAAGSAVVTTCV